MLTLYQFPPMLGLPNVDPYCMKVESFLRMTGIPYQVAAADLAQAPTGRAPWIADGHRLVADAELIVAHLKRTRGVDPDDWLGARERAVAHAFEVMLSQRLGFALAYSRWLDEVNWRLMRLIVLDGLPATSVARMREGVREQLEGQGLAAHAAEEVYALGCADVDALAGQLGAATYLMGERPCTVDAAAYAFLANLLLVPFASPLKRRAAAHDNLVEYCARMGERYFPERRAA